MEKGIRFRRNRDGFQRPEIRIVREKEQKKILRQLEDSEVIKKAIKTREYFEISISYEESENEKRSSSFSIVVQIAGIITTIIAILVTLIGL